MQDKLISTYRGLRPLSRLLYAKAWNAISRCSNPMHPQYSDYGGRGVRVHKPWLQDITTFVEYLAQLPGCDEASFVLDRENSNGHYEPGNLRFITQAESSHSRRQRLQRMRKRERQRVQELYEKQMGWRWWRNVQELQPYLPLMDAMRFLDDRSRRVIYERFWGDKTLKEVGEMFGVSVERVRQIEMAAINRLRAILQ